MKRKLRIIVLTALLLIQQPLLACTIFFLTEDGVAIFFNNEDFTNPENRIWFIPKGKNHFGCVFVGFDDGHAQGGMNSHGLAFDWYAGKPVEYQPDEKLIPIKGNSSERMLEQCITVEDAIKFYQTYAESSFANATIIIADKSRTSVIIGAKKGKLFFEKSSKSSILGGQGKDTFNRLYSKNSTNNFVNGTKILKECVATGEGGTKYSNSFNLLTGDIQIYDFSKGQEYTSLNLFEELKKGKHCYDIAK